MFGKWTSGCRSADCLAGMPGSRPRKAFFHASPHETIFRRVFYNAAVSRELVCSVYVASAAFEGYARFAFAFPLASFYLPDKMYWSTLCPAMPSCSGGGTLGPASEIAAWDQPRTLSPGTAGDTLEPPHRAMRGV